MGVIEGALNERTHEGAPSNGTTEVQTLTIGGTPTGGTFKLTFDGHMTAAITWSATTNTLLANINAALRALANIGASGITATEGSLSGGIGTVTLTFGGNLAKMVVPTITVGLNSLTGSAPTLAVAETTPGVDATGRGAGTGAQLIDITNGALYINTGTALEPVWTLSGVTSPGSVSATELAADAVTTAKILNANVTTAKIADANVTTGKLATKAVTGIKLDEAALNGLVFTGAAAAGACTLTGAKIGDKVVSLVNLTDSTDGKADFEATITVADQIQQSSASDLSLKKYAVLLVVKS